MYVVKSVQKSFSYKLNNFKFIDKFKSQIDLYNLPIYII